MVLKNWRKNGDYKTNFILELNKLGSLFDYIISKEKAQLYYDLLSQKISLNQFTIICNDLAQTFKPEYGLKFPLPAHFLEIIRDPESEEKFDEMYSELESGISHFTRISQITKDPIFIKLINGQGGLFNLRRWTTDDWKFNRGRLKDGYIALKNKDEKEDFEKIPDDMKDLISCISSKMSIIEY